MLLLSIVLEQQDQGLQEQSELFLECYGNLLIRQKTNDWIQQKASDLIRVVTDSKGTLATVFDFSALKYRERDDLEFVFKFWRDKTKPFDSAALYDIRQRQYLKNRFDNRENIFDWDFNMKLLERV